MYYKTNGVNMRKYLLVYFIIANILSSCLLSPDKKNIDKPYFPTKDISEWFYAGSGGWANETRTIRMLDTDSNKISVEYVRDRDLSDSVHQISTNRIYFKSGNSMSIDSELFNIDGSWNNGSPNQDNVVLPNPDSSYSVCRILNIFGENMLSSSCDSLIRTKYSGDTLTIEGGMYYFYKFTTVRNISIRYVRGIGMTTFSMVERLSGCYMTECHSGEPDTTAIKLLKYTDKNGNEYSYHE